jgi:hypothetical protein
LASVSDELAVRGSRDQFEFGLARLIRGTFFLPIRKRREPREACAAVEPPQRIIAEEFLYARTWPSEDHRREALDVWNLHYIYHRPHGAAGGQPPASLVPIRVNNVLASYSGSSGCECGRATVDDSWPMRIARLLFVVYGRDPTRINGNHEWSAGNVIGWWTGTYGIYRQPPRTVRR